MTIDELKELKKLRDNYLFEAEELQREIGELEKKGIQAILWH